ncbi:hypothetical protein SUDANB126_04720 [Streptomyces sp. enrichment culture]
MTKASTPGPLAPDGGPSGPTAAHEPSVGPYLHIPVPPPPPPGDTFDENGVPVALHVTEPILTNFLTVFQQLASDLAGRRVAPADAPTARRPDESTTT